MAETLEYPSHDGRTTIRALLWRDASCKHPLGIVQLVHGMAEHIERYDEFALALVDAGYAVCGHDHIGHGLSVVTKADWGNMPLKGGADILIADVHELRQAIAPCFAPDTPYFLFGHSMGSFVVRNYIAEHGAGLAGAIVCGTGHVPAATAQAGHAIAQALGKIRGERHKSTLLHNMSVGAYSKAIANARTPLDWLSHNEENVDRYLEDEACGFSFTCGGNATLMDLTGRISGPRWAKRVPKDLPILLIAGAEDPVGDNGKGVRAVRDLLVKAGVRKVNLKLLKGMRHEIMNESGREAVFADITAWLNEQCAQHA